MLVYLLNRSPTKSLQNVTPKEAWSSFKPSVRHLKVFGSTIFIHIPDELRTKLDDKSEKAIFIGYKLGKLGGYKLYNPTIQKVIISTDVIFDKTHAWDWNMEKELDPRKIVLEESEDVIEAQVS